MAMSSSHVTVHIPKRLLYVVVLAVVSFLLLHQFYANRTALNHSLTPSNPYHPPPKTQDGRFHWSDRVQHYPIPSLVPLPDIRPKLLPAVQHQFSSETANVQSVRLQRRAEVKATFQKCWKSYHDRAWMHDELAPLSGGWRDTFGGWAATLVDNLDTLWIMDMKQEFREAAAASTKIDFGKSTDGMINVFETIIRYLGGFLAAYDLSGDQGMLDRAADVGEMVLVAFDTPNHLPITRWEWKKAADGERQQTPDGMLVSELGSFSLEFTRLSQLTGDQRFYDAVHRVTKLFDAQQDKTKLPGMWPVVVNPRIEDFTFDTGFTLGGMSDSLYEYFPKEFALLGGVEPVYQKMYEKSMATAKQALFFRPMTPKEDDILISGNARAFDDGRGYLTDPEGQHLACFTGGMLGLGSRLFRKPEDLDVARKLTDGCIWAYKSMARGIMPEIAHFVKCESKTHCPWDESIWHRGVMDRYGPSENPPTVQDVIKSKNLPPGFTNIDDKRYILRPEAIESVFMMYRITGDPKYQEAAWEMFVAINNVSKTEFANAAVSDISSPPSTYALKDDRMESFWLAETLKYLYLIFSHPDDISLDQFVFNTEAHPLRRPV